MPSFFPYLFAYALGGALYPGMELTLRGYSHWSMSLAGGLGMLAVHTLNTLLPALALPWKCLLCAAVITEIELCVGCIWNKDRRIWDYSQLPFHFRGQICLPYFLLWLALSLPALHLSNQIHRWIPRG